MAKAWKEEINPPHLTLPQQYKFIITYQNIHYPTQTNEIELQPLITRYMHSDCTDDSIAFEKSEIKTKRLVPIVISFLQ